jgi:hypothetical protein
MSEHPDAHEQATRSQIIQRIEPVAIAGESYADRLNAMKDSNPQ